MKSIHSHTCANGDQVIIAAQGGHPLAHGAFDSPQGEPCARTERSPESSPKTILVPLSLSRSSPGAFAVARNLAGKSGSRLVLLHVVQLNIVGEERGIQRARLLDELRAGAELQLQQLADCLGDQVGVEILVCEGRPAEAILEAARRLKADAIVLSTRGSRGISKWLHRNTALNVMRQAPCTIWLISPAKRNRAAKSMIADQKAVTRHIERTMFHERQNPFRSLLRILFS